MNASTTFGPNISWKPIPIPSAVSCPFCLQMFEEGISAKGQQDSKRARDLIEIVDEAT